jgi:hypothetical protein
MSDIEPPAGLDAAGQRLWDSVMALYVLTPSELRVLEEACRTTDELTRIEEAIKELPGLTVRGSVGQPKGHPLLEEARRHRMLLERLTGALALPNDDQQTTGLSPRSRHAQKAAQARWNRKTAN